MTHPTEFAFTSLAQLHGMCMQPAKPLADTVTYTDHEQAMHHVHDIWAVPATAGTMYRTLSLRAAARAIALDEHTRTGQTTDYRADIADTETAQAMFQIAARGWLFGRRMSTDNAQATIQHAREYLLRA